jgi:hypothetical protein
MRTIAAIPAAALLAGAAFGLSVREPHFALAYVLVSARVAGAIFAWMLRRRWLLVASVSLGFFTGGWILSAVSGSARGGRRCGSRSKRSRVRGGRCAHGRRMPEDDEAFASSRACFVPTHLLPTPAFHRRRG